MRTSSVAGVVLLILSGCGQNQQGPPEKLTDHQLHEKYDKVKNGGRGPLDGRLVEVSFTCDQKGQDKEGYWVGGSGWAESGKDNPIPRVVCYLTKERWDAVPQGAAAPGPLVVLGTCQGVRHDPRGLNGYYVAVKDCTVRQ